MLERTRAVSFATNRGNISTLADADHGDREAGLAKHFRVYAMEISVTLGHHDPGSPC